MRERYPSFTFTHGHGLGVLAVGASRTADIDWLTALPRWGDESADVQRFFSTIGDLWTQHLEADHARAASAESIAAREAAVAQMSEQLRRASEAEAQFAPSAMPRRPVSPRPRTSAILPARDWRN